MPNGIDLSFWWDTRAGARVPSRDGSLSVECVWHPETVYAGRPTPLTSPTASAPPPLQRSRWDAPATPVGGRPPAPVSPSEAASSSSARSSAAPAPGPRPAAGLVHPHLGGRIADPARQPAPRPGNVYLPDYEPEPEDA